MLYNAGSVCVGGIGAEGEFQRNPCINTTITSSTTLVQNKLTFLNNIQFTNALFWYGIIYSAKDKMI